MHQDPASTAFVMGLWATLVPALFAFTLGQGTTGRTRRLFLALICLWSASSAATAVLALLGAEAPVVFAGKVLVVLAVAAACFTSVIGKGIARRAEERARWAWMD